MKCLFLDIDGVIRVAMNPDGTNEQFSPALCRNLERLVVLSGARIIISSDWRRRMSVEEVFEHIPSEELKNHIHPDQLHTTVLDRWEAIEMWLAEHPEVDNYVVLDDRAQLFDGCSDLFRRRLVLCNGREGLVGSRVAAALRLFDGMSQEEKDVFQGGGDDSTL